MSNPEFAQSTTGPSHSTTARAGPSLVAPMVQAVQVEIAKMHLEADEWLVIRVPPEFSGLAQVAALQESLESGFQAIGIKTPFLVMPDSFTLTTIKPQPGQSPRTWEYPFHNHTPGVPCAWCTGAGVV
jgi:hypothetical protein